MILIKMQPHVLNEAGQYVYFTYALGIAFYLLLRAIHYISFKSIKPYIIWNKAI